MRCGEIPERAERLRPLTRLRNANPDLAAAGEAGVAHPSELLEIEPAGLGGVAQVHVAGRRARRPEGD
jgi:hypothetical protein